MSKQQGQRCKLKPSERDEIEAYARVGLIERTRLAFSLFGLVEVRGITSVSWTGSIYATATPSIVASS